jgi:hypothetical protein
MVLIQCLLPARGASGPNNEDTRAALAVTRRELIQMFKGVTAYTRSPAQGVWTAPDGHEERDDVLMIEVVTRDFDRQWWRAYAATLADRFSQETIHVRALPIVTLREED